MILRIKHYFVFLFTLLTFCSYGQTRTGLPYAIQQGTLNSQFTNITNMSRSFDGDFKLIRKTNLEIIRKNVIDSITQYQTEISSLKKNASSAVNSVQSLRDSVNTLTADLAVEMAKTDSIAFLGINFSKKSYHIIVWSMIIVFALSFIITLASFKKAKVDTNEHKKTTEELQDELQTLRKKSIEREQLLKRQLLDEQLKRNP